jgi:hypothetical protein
MTSACARINRQETAYSIRDSGTISFSLGGMTVSVFLMFYSGLFNPRGSRWSPPSSAHPGKVIWAELSTSTLDTPLAFISGARC